MPNSPEEKNSENLIDPIYEKFSKSIIRALGSTEFYEYFMDMISRANNRFQFSNRKMEKIVDLTWIDAIEEALDAFQNIISNPRNVIREEEIIVNVANAKKAGPDVVRHLAQHGSMVEDFNEDTGEVRPSKLMQKLRDDSTELYENRLAYTVLEDAYNFVRVRHDALLDAMSEEYGAKLKITSDMENVKELIHVDMFLHIKEKDDAIETDEKNREVFERISRIYRLLLSFMNSQFATQMKNYNRVRGNITKTNVLKRNPDYKKVVKLWEFLRKYNSVGYLIKITEQSPEIDERLQQDIYNNIMFQYIVLKSHLENEEERELPKPARTRKRKLKPKFVHQIIEELTEDYDLPDIEIRKVLIEELTKEQLMLEEEAERLRLVEEQEQRRREEEERRQEEERLRLEQEDEEKRIRREQEERELVARMEREIEDRRRSGIFKQEISLFESKKLELIALRDEEMALMDTSEPISDYADAAEQIEKEEQRRFDEEERARIREEEALARKLRLEEEEALNKKRAEEAAQLALDMVVLRIYCDEVECFTENLADRRKLRDDYNESLRLAREQFEMEKSQRLARK